MIKIAPSILSADFSALGHTVQTLEKQGADLIHVDVMDGQFVRPITFGSQMVAALRSHTSLPLDAHLMVRNPENQVELFAQAGADYITVHCEELADSSLLERIRAHGIKSGITINPHTPFEQIVPHLHHADLVLVMSVVPGYGGQSYIPKSTQRIEQVREYLQAHGLYADIQVDGGINLNTIREAADAGANIFVAGSSVFGAADLRAAMDALRQAAVG